MLTHTNDGSNCSILTSAGFKVKYYYYYYTHLTASFLGQHG